MKKSSKVSKKVFNAILIIEFFIVAAILFITILGSCSNTYDKNTIACIVILLCFPFLFKTLLIMAFENIEVAEESKYYVQQHLSKDYCVEVIPIKDKPAHKNFLTKELPKRAKFFAQIMDDDTVMISIKFNDETDRVPYSKLDSGDFTTYFKVFNS